MNDIKRLLELQKVINNNLSISYNDILFLQNHKPEIKALDDIKLAQCAGIDEQEFNSILAY